MIFLAAIKWLQLLWNYSLRNDCNLVESLNMILLVTGFSEERVE